jgi:hypothetical protein
MFTATVVSAAAGLSVKDWSSGPGPMKHWPSDLRGSAAAAQQSMRAASKHTLGGLLTVQHAGFLRVRNMQCTPASGSGIQQHNLAAPSKYCTSNAIQACMKGIGYKPCCYKRSCTSANTIALRSSCKELAAMAGVVSRAH